MTCGHCNGLGYVEAADQSVDACRSCAARAEAEWRFSHAIIKRPVLRVVPRKEQAA